MPPQRWYINVQCERRAVGWISSALWRSTGTHVVQQVREWYAAQQHTWSLVTAMLDDVWKGVAVNAVAFRGLVVQRVVHDAGTS